MLKMPMSTARTRRFAAVLVLGAAVSSCFTDPSGVRRGSAEVAVDLRGLRAMAQVANDTTSDVQSAAFSIYLVSGKSRREVASHLFTASDLDAASRDTGTTTFTMVFPYQSAADDFEVQGWGFSAQGDTLYRVGPTAFSMKQASRDKNQASVTVVVSPTYVGPGRTATRLVITPRVVATTEGKQTSVSAELRDASGKVLSSPSFRVRWSSLDPAVAVLRNDRVGNVVGGDQSGTTKLTAWFEPMNLWDTVSVVNSVLVGELRVVSGNSQTGRAGTQLAGPITLQAFSATGKAPLRGVSLTVSVSSGGSVKPSGTITTGTTGSSNGVATFTWTLGPTVGQQTALVRIPGGASVTVTATATAAASAPNAP